MIHTALVIAPDGHAKRRMEDYLYAYRDEVLTRTKP
jgi:hypothetical protein